MNNQSTNASDLPFISVIIPIFNEEKYIGTILDNILEQDYPKDRMEVFAVDGNSKDRTREIISGYSQAHSFIHLLNNERQYVPFALNSGIKKSKGDLIIILGAHAAYPGNYISSLVHASLSLNADNVGGLCVAKPPDNALKSLSIAKALTCPFGVGNAHFRIGSRGIKKVDTVTFGCYKRSVFERIGLFDEDLLRNQDDEFNARLVKNKGSIYLIPDISVSYFTRTSICSIIRMFYQYGLFKPLVSKKIGRPTTVRQLVPFVFVLFLFSSLLVGIFIPPVFLFTASVLLLHFICGFYFAFRIAMATKRQGVLLFLPWLFLFIHLSYGWGYIVGIFKFIILRQKKGFIGHTR